MKPKCFYTCYSFNLVFLGTVNLSFTDSLLLTMALLCILSVSSLVNIVYIRKFYVDENKVLRNVNHNDSNQTTHKQGSSEDPKKDEKDKNPKDGKNPNEDDKNSKKDEEDEEDDKDATVTQIFIASVIGFFVIYFTITIRKLIG
jgi:hypothetical protein